MRVDTSDLSWFGQYEALLPAEGDEAYITRTEVLAIGITSLPGEGKPPKSLELIEVSANTERQEKTTKYFASPLGGVMTALFIHLGDVCC